jgi:thiamine biosynthesis protein ThiS
MMMKIKIFLNGELLEIESGLSISQLLINFEIDPKKIAIEKDLEIINPQDFNKIILTENSKVEIVHFIGGG